MRLTWIEARDFRNHRAVSLQVPAGLTAVVGPNARGKTNLLEALHYLCTLSSSRVSADLPLVRSEAEAAYLRGEVESLAGRALIEVEIRAGGQNVVRVNRSPVRRRRDLRRHVTAVSSGPEDLAIVQGDPDQRRRLMDEAVRTLWPAKETAIRAYDRALRQRNRLIKEWVGTGVPPDLEAWDEELVRHGTIVTRSRAEAVEWMRGEAAAEFRALSGGTEEALVVEYRPSVPGLPVEESFRARLAERRDDELVRRTTLVGPHRDDLALTVEGLAARGFASHGEAWGAAVSLRLAQGRAAAKESGEDPVMLLDDPFSALDPERRRRLARGLEGWEQVLIAVPDDSQVPEGARIWRVEESGVVVE